MEPIQNLAVEVMNSTGLSKLALAAFLQVDNSLLTRYEAGTRTLPAEAMLKLALLYKNLPQAKPIAASPVAATTGQQQEAQQHAAYCQAKSVQLGRQLAQMRQAHEQAAQLLQLLAILVQQPGEATNKQKSWLDEQEYQAGKKLEKNNWLEQQKLEIKLVLLQQEAKLYSALVQPVPNV